MPINPGNSAFSSGPSITQAVPVAQRTPVVPMEYGIPKMSMDSMFSSIDPRVSEVPEFHPGIDAADSTYKNGVRTFTNAEAPTYDYQDAPRHDEHTQGHMEAHLSAVKEASAEKRPMSVKPFIGRAKTYREENLPAHDDGDEMSSMSEDAVARSGNTSPGINAYGKSKIVFGGDKGRTQHNKPSSTVSKPEQSDQDHLMAIFKANPTRLGANDDDMSSMSEDADDANPITPFHDVIRNHGGHYAGHTREGKKGEIRKNIYKVPNPKGGEEKVELHAHQGGPDYGEVNSITHSGDPEATAPRVNNSPEKLDRNIHAQSYRGAPDRPKKMKPAEVRANRKFLNEL